MKLRPRSYRSDSESPTLAGERKLHDWHRRRVELDDVRRISSRRQYAQNRLHDGGDLRQRKFHLDVRLEVDANDRHALVRLRFRVLDVVDGRRERALAHRNDAAFHLGRRQAGVGPDDGDDGDIDIGKDILRRLDSRAEAEQKNKQREDDEGIRAPQRELNNPHAILKSGAVPVDSRPAFQQPSLAWFSFRRRNALWSLPARHPTAFRCRRFCSRRKKRCSLGTPICRSV